MPDFFAELRNGFADVASHARHVRIDNARLREFANELPDKTPFPDLDAGHHFIGSPEETAAYVLALDAINFGSGYKPRLMAEGLIPREDSIYYTIALGLKDEFAAASASGIGIGARLAAITESAAQAMLRLGDGPHSRDFSMLVADRLNEIAGHVERQHGGRFLRMVETAGGSVEPFVRELAGLPGFADLHDYHGRPVAFYKRAQIAAADMQLAFHHFRQEAFHDTARLTMFADNAVPHVLRTARVLVYDDALAAAIDQETDIASGSAAEIELRACAAHAVELMAARKNLPAMTVDHILWHASRQPDYRRTPPHRTLTPFY